METTGKSGAIAEEKWMQEALKELKQLSNGCSEKQEQVLNTYILAMVQVLNGLNHLNCTKLHHYEKEMIMQPMKLFYEYFIEQVNYYLSCTETKKRKDIQEDLEEAVNIICQIYRNVVDSRRNMERKMSSGIAINTGLVDFSPKWGVFYNYILKQVIKAFSANDKIQYAFFFYPTIESSVSTQALLRERQQSGKVVVVRIPEFVLLSCDTVVVSLVHETFHVLTRDQKQLHLRAELILLETVSALEQCLFRTVDLGCDAEKKRNDLMGLWFGDLKHEIQKVKNTPKEEIRTLYSDRLIDEYYKVIMKCLEKMRRNLSDSMEEVCMDSQKEIEELFDQYDNMKKQEQIIRENYQRLLIDKSLRNILEFFAGMFKELFADIACVITLNLFPKSYERTFSDSMIFTAKDGFYDLEKELRVLVVAQVICHQGEVVPVPCQGAWKKYLERYNQEKDALTNMSESMKKEKVVLKITKDLVDYFVDYGDACAQEFCKLANERKDELESLRQLYQDIIQKPEEVLTRIFLRYYE